MLSQLRRALLPSPASFSAPAASLSSSTGFSSLLLGSSREDKEQQQQQQHAGCNPLSAVRALQPASLSRLSALSGGPAAARRTLASPSLAPSFAASGLSGPMAPRRMAPLGLGASGLPLRRGPLALAHAPTPSASSVRSYYSDGDLMGYAFWWTTDLMFWTGLIGAVIFRRNLIVMLLCSEIVFLACNLNFLFAAAYLDDITGMLMSITITTIAACETAIGLALCVTYFHLRSAIDVEALNLLK